MLGDGTPILPKGLKVLDIWQFACETKLSQKAYKKLARARGWVSPAGNIKTGAEFCYRYTSGNHDFIEDHTALSDAIIETQILACCYAQKLKFHMAKSTGKRGDWFRIRLLKTIKIYTEQKSHD